MKQSSNGTKYQNTILRTVMIKETSFYFPATLYKTHLERT